MKAIVCGDSFFFSTSYFFCCTSRRLGNLVQEMVIWQTKNLRHLMPGVCLRGQNVEDSTAGTVTALYHLVTAVL